MLKKLAQNYMVLCGIKIINILSWNNREVAMYGNKSKDTIIYKLNELRVEWNKLKIEFLKAIFNIKE